MVGNDALLNRLRALGFSFKRQTERVAIYKQKGSTRRVTVSKRNTHDPDYVRVVLRMAGMPLDQVEAFIKETDHTHH